MKKYLFFAAFVFVFLNLPIFRTLSISNRKNRSERVYSTIAAKSGFAISYTHSVNKGRVHDFYKSAENGALVLFMTQFVSYGAGIPEPEETEGATFRTEKDGYIIENLNRIVPKLVMAVGVVADHSVSFGKDAMENRNFSKENEFFLKDFFKVQTSLVFEIKRVSILNYLTAKKLKRRNK